MGGCFNRAMSSTLVTGFTPFDGRTVNASWIAARSLAGQARTLEVPVVWGAPLAQLAPICDQDCPTAVIALGEGRPGWFDIETVARNARADRVDNNNARPDPARILDSGADTVTASIDARRLQSALLAAGYPTRISGDAGAFLCEEMLYTLEYLRQSHEALETVTFVHLPPYGTPVSVGGRSRRCDDALLSSFAATVLNAVTSAAPPVQNVDNA